MENTISTKTPEQELFDELMELGKIGIAEFGGVKEATEKLRFLNSTLRQNTGMIRFMADEKNIGMAQKMISGLNFFKKK